MRPHPNTFASLIVKFLFDLLPVILFFTAFKIGESHAQQTADLLGSWLGSGISVDQAPILAATAVAIIASVALQVPQSYTVESYVINSGSNISAMAHIKLSHEGEMLEGVALGDGPIDASFLALEKVVNRHYELDDFQIRAVTEGREAMGETVVRLVSNGRLYSGRGISTDIVFSSIQAYVNALNKIAYEEGEA